MSTRRGDGAPGWQPPRLTTRQLIVAKLVSTGARARQVAEALGIQQHTAYRYVVHIEEQYGGDASSPERDRLVSERLAADPRLRLPLIDQHAIDERRLRQVRWSSITAAQRLLLRGRRGRPDVLITAAAPPSRTACGAWRVTDTDGLHYSSADYSANDYPHDHHD